jgi:ABC-type cobalamin transport system ATPase subunit
MKTIAARAFASTLAVFAAIFVTHAHADTSAGVISDTKSATQLEQKSERIVHHDSGSRIEEVRVGGQTRSIQVDTNSALPGYQVQPLDPNRMNDGRSNGSGKSAWRVLKF